MWSVRITYDSIGDILYITFGQPTTVTGYQLSDQILLRVDPQTRTAPGLTILNFSVHTRTPGDILLPGIEEDPEAKSSLLKILCSFPLSHFLHVVEEKQGISARVLSPSLQEAFVG